RLSWDGRKWQFRPRPRWPSVHRLSFPRESSDRALAQRSHAPRLIFALPGATVKEARGEGTRRRCPPIGELKEIPRRVTGSAQWFRTSRPVLTVVIVVRPGHTGKQVSGRYLAKYLRMADSSASNTTGGADSAMARSGSFNPLPVSTQTIVDASGTFVFS